MVHLEGDSKGFESTINGASKSLNTFANDATKLDDIRAKFEGITKSAAPLNKKLKDLQKMMANMNLEGLNNTDLFAEMAEQAGTFADAIGDARQAVNAFASDTMNLDAITQGFHFITGAVTTMTGVMGLLGVETDKVQEAMLKIQSAIAVVNGVTSISNILNKDSVLMLKIKQIQIKVNSELEKQNTKAIQQNTIAETTNKTATTTDSIAKGANTVAITTNTVATTASTTAKKIWNTVVAISKALMGDFTGLVLIGATALATYAIASENTTDKLKKQSQETENLRRKQQKYIDETSSKSSELVSKYQQLRFEWNNLKTTAEKTKWIKDNKIEFENLGLSIDDLVGAENVFVNNTDKVVKALELRAKAMAAQSMMSDAYSDYYKQKYNNANSVSGGGYYKKVKAGDTISKEEGAELLKKVNSRTVNGEYLYNDGYYKRKGNREELTEKGAKALNEIRIKEARERKSANDKKAEEQLTKSTEFLTKEISSTTKEIQSLGVKELKSPLNDSISTTDNGKTIKNEKIDYLVSVDDGSLDVAEKKLQAWQNKLKITPTTDEQTIKECNEQIEKWTKKTIIRKMVLEGKIDPKIVEETEKIEDKIDELNKKKLTLSVETDKTELEQLENEINDLEIQKFVNYVKIGFDIEIEKGSLPDLKNDLKDLEKTKEFLISVNAKSEDVKKIDDLIKQKKEEIEKLQVKYGIKPYVSEGSLNYIKKKIKEKEEEIELALNTNIDSQSMRKMQAELEEWRKKEESKEIELGVRINTNPTISRGDEDYIVPGSVADKRESYKNAQAQVKQMQEDFKLGIIDEDYVMNKLSALNEKLQEFGFEPIVLTFNEDGTLTTSIENLERYKEKMEEVADITSSMGNVFGNLGSAIGGTGGEMLNFAGQSINAIGQIIPQIVSLVTAKEAEALASGTASASAMPFPANIAAIASIIATLTSVFASLPKFESGGIVGGSSFTGDKLLARVNSGEMILNQKQQKNLYKSMEQAQFGTTVSSNVNISGEFTVKGSNLKTCLNNFNSKVNNIR